MNIEYGSRPEDGQSADRSAKSRSTVRSGEPEPLPIAEPMGPLNKSKKITAFGKSKTHEERWSRTPNTTGRGAIHVKTFHGKLTDDSLNYMDQCINEWLDAHPEYEVKFVTSTVGTLTGKTKEPHLICQVWV
ncbi:MAG: hypothetical protein EA377_05955 [Phycisphaerales bacterium]|nr:MAG: hypothetical protein EA377_05955 [Phycisphaerales bacterium]